jgi:type II secretory pathway pseudopilin PulG
MTNRTHAVTLFELIAVIVILGIVAGLGVINTSAIREKTLDKEAKAILKLIQQAQKIHNLEKTHFYPDSGSTSNISDINQSLKLMLPQGAERSWNYTLWSTGCAQAARNGADGRFWHIAITDTEPVSGAGCP